MHQPVGIFPNEDAITWLIGALLRNRTIGRSSNAVTT